jgi:hypothetical protein
MGFAPFVSRTEKHSIRGRVYTKEDPDIVSNSKKRSQKTEVKEKEEEKNSPGDLPGP